MLSDFVFTSEGLETEITHYFSITHLQSSLFFRDECQKIETSNNSDIWLQVSQRHQALAIGSIFSSVAFLEASVNEIFTDAYNDNFNGPLESIDPHFVKLLKSLAKPNSKKSIIENLSALEKYDLALIVADKQAMDRSRNPTQAVHSLIKLRNTLIHPLPTSQTIYHDDDEKKKERMPHTLEKNLKCKFQENKLTAHTMNPFFPDKCLGYGCANWAVESSVEFVRKFSDQVGTKVIFEHVLCPRQNSS